MLQHLRQCVQSPILYHYCSFSSFKNIIASKHIYLMPVNSMEDSTECEHLFNVFFDELKKNENEYIKAEWIPFVDDLKRNIIEFNKHRYIACFTPDGNKPCQWEEYADAGQGVAIGFDCRELILNERKAFSYNAFGNIENTNTGLFPVIYDKDKQLDILDICTQEAYRKASKETISLTILFILTNLAAIFKHSDYLNENECRLWYMDTKELSINLVKENLCEFNQGDFMKLGKKLKIFKFPLSAKSIVVINLGPKNTHTPEEVADIVNTAGHFSLDIDSIKRG